MIATLADLLFPRACVGCGGPAGEGFRYLCWNCMAQIKLIHPPFCEICGDPVEGRVDDVYTCSWCLKSKPAFDLARSAARYTGVFQHVVQDFKYRGATWLCGDLVSFMLACLKTHFPLHDIDLIVYVPLYPARERERTYNQSRLLAGTLGRALGNMELSHGLSRVRPTRTQTHLTAPQRITNVRNVFAATGKDKWKGCGALLVDDVMTTGATLNECSRVLKEAGMQKVYVLTVARG